MSYVRIGDYWVQNDATIIGWLETLLGETSSGQVFDQANYQNLPATQAAGGLGISFVTGTTANDVIYGDVNQMATPNGGSDFIFLMAGDDIAYGQGGDDTIYGQDGNDTIFGSSGDDSLFGGAGDDYVVGGPGADYINGGAGNDFLTGGDGFDPNNPDEGDVIFGGLGNDSIYGKQGNDDLSGGAGDDLINGSTGADVLNGGYGDDILNGGLDNDSLTGDIGFDTFLFTGLEFGDDVVYDFAKGFDLIVFADTAAYSGDLRTTATASGTLVWFDDPAFTGTILLEGITNFAASDYMFI